MIPVFTPWLTGREAELVQKAIIAGEISGSGGRYLQEFEERFAEYCGCGYGVAVSSGSTALHLAALACGIGPGDEVLVSALTNIATGNAVAVPGGRIVPVDSEAGTWNMDTSLLEDLLTPNTRAILPVHIYGHPVDMDAVRAVAKRHRLAVIEDCAEAHGASIKGRKVGSFGHAGCFSFYVNKVITTGEGGMVTTSDEGLAQSVRELRNLCFRQPRFYHTRLGYNYRLTNMQAAMGVAQLENIEKVIERKRWVADQYTQRLENVPSLRLPIELPDYRNVYWMYCVVFGSSETRELVAHRLQTKGIETRTMFCPLNLQPSYTPEQLYRNQCPVAEGLWRKGLYLPSSPMLTEHQIDFIVEGVRSCVSM